MPNIRRTFPGPSRGKQFGKALRAQQEEESDDDESSDDSVQVVQPPRGGGKQLGTGKYLRPSQDDDDSNDDESSEEEEPPSQVVRVQPRGGGGKNILRMQQPQSDEEESSEEEEEEEKQQTIQVNPRGMGKSLARMRPQPPSESSEDEDEDDEPAVIQKVFPPHRGKQMRKPEPPVSTGKQLPAPVANRGKQLRRPEPAVEAPKPPPTGGGKQLRRPEEDDNESEEDDPASKPQPSSTATTTTISRSPGGGKQLRRPEPESEEDKPATKPSSGIVVAKSPAGGKQLRRPEPAAPKPKPPAKKSQGKQLRKQPVKEESSEFEESDEELPSDDDDDDEDFDDAPPPPKKKKPVGRPRRASAKKKQIVEESEEEEIFGDDDASSEEELDINNSEALIKDEKDRKYLDSLTEIDREAILAERYEKEKEKQDLQKAIKEAKRKEESTKPRKAPAKKKKLKTEGDEALAKSLAGRRSSARERDVSGAKSKKAAALAALKRERRIQNQYVDESSDSMDFDDESEDSDEEYNELQPWQKASSSRKASTKEDDGSDMDIDDDEKPSKSRGAPARQSTETAAGLEDYVKVTVPRRRLARWCDEPFFQSAILECFVRLCIGEDKGEMVYRLCEIVDVQTNEKSYKFPVANKDDKPVTTNQYLKLRFGNSEREFPMYLVSDAPPDESDVQKYITSQKNNRLELLSKRRATKLKRLQDHLVSNYTYTTEDIEKNLRKRKKQGKSLGKLGAEQTKVAIAVKAANDAVAEAAKNLSQAKKALLEFGGPSHEEAEFKRAVEEATSAVEVAKKDLKEKLEEESSMLDAAKKRKTKLTGREKDLHWAKVNQRALQMNQQADREGYRAQKEASTKGEKEKFNPYARRKVKPKILWEVGQAPEDAEQREKDEEKKESSEAPAVVKQVETTAPDSVTEMERTALTESHQFAIDEEGLAGGDLGLGKKKPVRNRVRKGISLAEYLERKENNTL